MGSRIDSARRMSTSEIMIVQIRKRGRRPEIVEVIPRMSPSHEPLISGSRGQSRRVRVDYYIIGLPM